MTHSPTHARCRLLRGFRALATHAQAVGDEGTVATCRLTIDRLAGDAIPDAALTEPLVTAYAMLLHELGGATR